MHMKLANGILVAAIALTFGGVGARAQAPTPAANHDNESVQTFDLTNVSQAQEGNEIVTAVRNLINPHSRVYFVPSQNSIIISATPDQLAVAAKIIKDLDRPNKTYRLTYAFTEMDAGKRIGTQHYSLIVVAGQRTTLKQGSQVPIVTGSYTTANSTTQNQVTYLDVGLNFDVTLDEFVNGVRLRSRVEQSSVAEQTSGVGAQDPIIRRTSLEGTSFLTPGKPLILGSLDIPGSTRHMDVDVVMEAVK
jgi:type II secretory pathway component GspD/PulD (secretin)